MTPAQLRTNAAWLRDQLVVLTGWIAGHPDRWPARRTTVALRAIHAGDFTAATGLKIDRNRSPIETMVDKLTGFGDHVFDQFVEWVTTELYGLEGAPVLYRMEIAKRRGAGANP